MLSLALKYSKKRQGISDGSRAISFRRQWVNMNGGSLHTRSFRRMHLLGFGYSFAGGFSEALTSDLEGTGVEMNNS